MIVVSLWIHVRLITIYCTINNTVIFIVVMHSDVNALTTVDKRIKNESHQDNARGIKTWSDCKNPIKIDRSVWHSIKRTRRIILEFMFHVKHIPSISITDLCISFLKGDHTLIECKPAGRRRSSSSTARHTDLINLPCKFLLHGSYAFHLPLRKNDWLDCLSRINYWV